MRRAIRQVFSWILLVTMLCPVQGLAAVTYIRSAVGGTGPEANTVTSASIQVDAGSNRALFAVIGMYTGSGTDFLSSCTFNGGAQSFTPYISYGVPTTPDGRNADTDRHIEIWRLVAPTSTTATVVCTLAAAGTRRMGLAVYYMEGVDQTTPLSGGAVAYGDNAGPAAVTITSATGDLVIDIVQSGASAAPFGSNGTETMDRIDDSMAEGSQYAAGAATVAMQHTIASSTAWMIGGANVKAASGGGGGGCTGGGLLLRGVGC